jgi:hypothetical protein
MLSSINPVVGHFVIECGAVAINHMGNIRNASTVSGIKPEMRRMRGRLGMAGGITRQDPGTSGKLSRPWYREFLDGLRNSAS